MSKITFITGKGGVGKTTIAVATALNFAAKDEKTLLISIDSHQQLESLFEVKNVGLREVRIRKKLFIAHYDPVEALNHFVRQSFKISQVSNLIIQHKMYEYFAITTPGIKELAVLSRIYSIIDSSSSFLADDFDRIVVDAPATGHTLDLFYVPQAIIEAVGSGPMVAESHKIKDYMKDPAMTSANIVTTPEEISLNEGRYLYDKFINVIGVSVKDITINFAPEEIIPPSILNDFSFDKLLEILCSILQENDTSPNSQLLKEHLKDDVKRNEVLKKYLVKFMEEVKRLDVSIKIHHIPYIYRSLEEKNLEQSLLLKISEKIA